MYNNVSSGSSWLAYFIRQIVNFYKQHQVSFVKIGLKALNIAIHWNLFFLVETDTAAADNRGFGIRRFLRKTAVFGFGSETVTTLAWYNVEKTWSRGVPHRPIICICTSIPHFTFRIPQFRIFTDTRILSIHTAGLVHYILSLTIHTADGVCIVKLSMYDRS